MQIEPTLARLVRLNFGLSRYYWTLRTAETFAEPKLWSNYLLRSKFSLSKSQSKSEVVHCAAQTLFLKKTFKNVSV